MPNYVYRTIPQHPGEEARYLQLTQSLKDAPFTSHPETGEPIRRVGLAGFGIPGSQNSGIIFGSCCCGPDSSCCH